jgi:hypothetical protein
MQFINQREFKIQKFLQSSCIRKELADRLSSIYVALENINVHCDEQVFTINDFLINIPGNMLLKIIIDHALNDKELVTQFMDNIKMKKNTRKENKDEYTT